MKKTISKWMFAFIVAVSLFFAARHMTTYYNWYVDFYPNTPVDVVATNDDQRLYINTGGEFEPFVISGVSVDSVIPGYYSNDFAADEDTYYEWLCLISEMGANTVSVKTVMDPDFYNALYRHNMENTSKLYLLQGITVADYDQNNADDAYHFFNKMINDGQRAVNVINGNQIGALGRMRGSGNYIANISQWTLGYIIGNDWVSYTVAYTDNSRMGERPYQGEFFSAAEGASPFESLLARAMDNIMSYESKRYKTQRLFSFSNSLTTDPLEYTASVRMQLDKISAVDAENIRLSEKVKSGFFASYRMYGGIENFVDCLTDEERLAYKDILAQLDVSSIYDGYAHFLNLYHSMPVVISDFGHSTSRNTDKREGGSQWQPVRLTEKEQGEAIVEWYDAFIGAGSQGAVISTWQDNWTRTTWNTWYAVNEKRQKQWRDVQSLNTGFGIMSFDTGGTQRVCLVDGNIDEWEGRISVAFDEGMALYAAYDEGYMYFMINKSGLGENDVLYIPIDTTEKSGSNYFSEYNMLLDRQADFLLVLDGRENSKLLVQERYDSLQMAYMEQITGKNSYTSISDITKGQLSPLLSVLQIEFDAYIDLTVMSREERQEYALRDTFETGLLRYGNASPFANNYDSLADFYYGQDCVEIRIPWQLLNFSDPSLMMIHDDYYENYGVEEMPVSKMYLGIASENTSGRVPMLPFELIAWNSKINYQPRLKQSYYIIKEHWREG